MAAIRPPKPVKLFVAMLSSDRDLLKRARQLLGPLFGKVEAASDFWPFEHTNYYEHELGEGVERQFLSFADSIYPDALADIKRQTNELERRIASDLALPLGSRPVNLDPGYLALSKIVLATTKDYNHRIYLQNGIYAEVTLTFKAGRWAPWPWTYPDYASGVYNDFFQAMRESLKAHLAGHCPASGEA